MKFQGKSMFFLKSKYFWAMLIISMVFLINMRYMFITNMANVDEFASISVPAYFAGHDWSDFVSKLNFHGYGFTVLLTPFFKGEHSGIYIYKMVMAGALVLRILMAVMTFYISFNFFELNYKTSALIAIVCEYGTLKADDGMRLSALTELPFAFFMLVSVLFFLKGAKSSGGKKHIYFSLMCISMAYNYLIHSRVIIIWFSVTVILVLYTVMYRQFNKRIFIYFAVFFVAILLFAKFDSYVQGKVWRLAEGEALSTGVVNVAKTGITSHLKKIFDFELLKAAIYMFFSLMGTLTLYTGGLIWFFTAINMSALIILWKKREERDKQLIILILFSMISFYIMNVSMALASAKAISGSNLRWLTYIRYCIPFAYLLVLTALVCLFKNVYSKKFVSCFCVIGLSVSVLTLCWKTANHLQSSGYRLSYSILNRVWYDSKNDSVEEYFLRMSIVSVSLSVLAMLFLYRNKKIYFLSVYVLFSLLTDNEMYNYYKNRDINTIVVKTNETVEIGELDFLNNCSLYIGGSTVYIMQSYLALYPKNVLYQTNYEKIDLSEMAVYLTDSVKDSEAMDIHYIFVLDSNEYLFTSDESIAKNMAEAGYEQY